MSTTSALAYHEPPITTILILSSFLLLLAIVNHVGNKLLYCGLIGQIFVGITWGTPGADWLSDAVQNAVMQLGYLGLILMVYEGGLSTKVKLLRANLFLSALVATIGISCPIALSFVLAEFMPITPLQAFAAGAALCSTSLGTTFTVLSTSGLSESRLGVVLSSAAMMDDVVGLIMVQVVSNLGQDSSAFDAISVVRPLLVSIAFAVLLPLACVWIVKPLVLLDIGTPTWIHKLVTSQQATFVLSTLALLAMVTGSSYAGTSNLFAAYLTGLVATWHDDLPATGHRNVQACRLPVRGSAVTDKSKVAAKPASPSTLNDTPLARPATPPPPTEDSIKIDTGGDGELRNPTPGSTPRFTDEPVSDTAVPDSHMAEGLATAQPRITATTIYESYYAPAVESILKPFFFASIGFSIPITRMFTGDIIWRGLVYAALMALGKLLCGVCLLRIEIPLPIIPFLRKLASSSVMFCWPWHVREKASSSDVTRHPEAPENQAATTASPVQPAQTTDEVPSQPSTPPNPLSIYPAAMLGTAMIARGEIGFLISSVAESTGIYGTASGDGSSELFLVVTWAILICTILGPLVVGILTKRVKRLQEIERQGGSRSGRTDPLGIWGVVSSG